MDWKVRRVRVPSNISVLRIVKIQRCLLLLDFKGANSTSRCDELGERSLSSEFFPSSWEIWCHRGMLCSVCHGNFIFSLMIFQWRKGKLKWFGRVCCVFWWIGSPRIALKQQRRLRGSLSSFFATSFLIFTFNHMDFTNVTLRHASFRVCDY